MSAASTQAMTPRGLDPVSLVTPQPTAMTAATALAKGTRWIAASE